MRACCSKIDTLLLSLSNLERMDSQTLIPSNKVCSAAVRFPEWKKASPKLFSAIPSPSKSLIYRAIAKLNVADDIQWLCCSLRGHRKLILDYPEIVPPQVYP